MGWGDLGQTTPDEYLRIAAEDGRHSFDAPLAQALEKRYRAQGPKEMAGPLSQDMGLGDYRLRAQSVAPPPVMENGKPEPVLGDFDALLGRVRVSPAYPPEKQLATLAHELMHARDFAQSGKAQFNNGSTKNHHDHFASFEPEMLLQLQAQAAIENGEPVSPAILDRYPNLKDVKPASSNRLSLPGHFGPQALPKSFWGPLK